VIVAEVAVTTATVLTVKLAVVAPSTTITLAGTVAAALSLERVATAPPDGAGPFKVTVPVEDDPPVTLVGFRETTESIGGLIVRVAVCVPL
jgi:hypothetical protein